MQYNYTQSNIDYDSLNNVSAFFNETTLITAPRLINSGGNLKLVSNGSKVFELVRFSDEFGDHTNFTISADGKSATMVMGAESYFYSTLSYTLKEGAAIPDPEPEPEPQVSYTITALDISRLTDNQCSMTVNGVAVIEGTGISDGDSLVVTSNGAGKFRYGVPIINGPSICFVIEKTQGGETHNTFDYFTINNSTYKSATKTYASPDSGDVVAFFIRAYSSNNSSGTPLDNVVFDWFYSPVKELNSNGVTATVNDVDIVPYGVVKSGDVIKLTAETGREFTTNPESPTVSAYFDVYEEGYSHNSYVLFTLQNSNKEAVLTAVMPELGYYFNSIVSTTIQATPTIVGTNNVYLITSEILKQVNKNRFKSVSNGGDSLETVTYDYGQFILSVLAIPFTVPAENVILPENITLANFDTGVSAPKINVDVLKINLGDIVVPAVSNNLYDYVNTVALLHLPRMDSIAIELEYVVGHTISIEYLLDCYTGDVTVNIYSDRIEAPIITKSVNIGVNVPYANTNNAAALDNGNIEVGGDNGVTTAFIELVKVDSVLKDGLFTIPVIDEAVLNTATGFIQVENVELKTRALRNEKEMLVNILNNGVIIK